MTDRLTYTRLFLLQYRAMETNTQENNRNIIRATVPEYIKGHLISSWEGRQNNFGDFYLNLDYKMQGQFLLTFGIPVLGFAEYKQKIKADPLSAMFLKPPVIIKWLRDLLVFFNNNGIDTDAIPGITLDYIPSDNAHCYGNSTNWANYMLSLPIYEQEAIFTAIEAYTLQKEEL